MTRALATAGLGVAMVLAGLAFGPTPLLVPGVGLVLVAGACTAWVGVAARGRLVRRFGAVRVVEGEPCTLSLEVRTPVAPPPGSELVEPLLAGWVGPPLDWRAREQRRGAEVRFPRRGLVTAEPARLVLRDPLGLSARELRSEAREVLVLPRIEPVRAVARPLGRRGAHAPAPASVGAEIEIHSLREAAPEASATRIHWPAFARTGTLIERTLTTESDRRPLVVLDAGGPTSGEMLDSAVRAAASLCVWLARARGCDLLLPGERRAATIDPGLVAWPALHARLAVVTEGRACAFVEDPGRGAVFWVTASPAARPPRGLRRAEGSERYVFAPGDRPGSAVLEVAGCYGVRLGRAPARAAA